MLNGKIVLVTGATRGIGKAIALTLGAAGATVIGTATTESGADNISMMTAASRPSIAAIEPVPLGTAACINSPLFLTNLMASNKFIELDATSAVYSPKL